MFAKRRKIKGLIGYFKLDDWWNNELSDQERNQILAVSNKSELLEENILSSGETKAQFLLNLAYSLDSNGFKNLAYKILEKAEQSLTNDPIEKHFFYHAAAEIFYHNSSNDPESLQKTIEACYKQIEISDKVIKPMLNDFGCLPKHTGYERLCIIFHRQGKYEEVINLAIKAKQQGWAGTWDNRIKRAENKLKKSQ